MVGTGNFLLRGDARKLLISAAFRFYFIQMPDIFVTIEFDNSS